MIKIDQLLDELEEHPETGTGKPERLKNILSGYWSRRINKEHRLVYSIDGEKVIVTVISAYGHY
ncbi:MAG: Txe/YoeB family addiction module toxin [Cyclobacterium sp.]|nr:Txe/YoeB family addiction module toxin [Cyclobacterium sp.]